MLSLPFGGRLFLANAPTDLRKGYDGLSAIVQNEFGLDPMQGGAYVFLNRRLTQVRILFWDRDGYCVLGKRLEQGTFRRVKQSDGSASVEIDAAELAMLFEGVDAKEIRRRRRYQPREMSVVSSSQRLRNACVVTIYRRTDDGPPRDRRLHGGAASR